MKTFFRLFSILFCISYLFVSCEDETTRAPEPEPEPEEDLFESPLTVLAAIDNDFSMANVTTESRAAIDINAPEGGVVDPAGLVAVINSETETKRLTGEVSVTSVILGILKNEVHEAIGDQAFSVPYTQPIEASHKFCEKSYIDIVIETIEIKEPDADDAVFVYAEGTVDVGLGMDLPWKFILKCTKNEIGTLDTELYMMISYGEYQPSYSKFTCTSTSKTKLDWEVQMNDYGQFEDFWSKITITSSGITGYKYSKAQDSEHAYTVALIVDSDYTATTKNKYSLAESEEDSITSDINSITGETIASGYSEDYPYWIFNVSYLNLPAGYSIQESADTFHLFDAEGADTNIEVRQRTGRARVDGEIPSEDNAYWYEIEGYSSSAEVTIGEDTVSSLCKVSEEVRADLTERSSDLYQTHPAVTGDEMEKPESGSDATLPALLEAWISGLAQ